MITMQTMLLKVALDHRPSPSSKGGDAALPFAGHREGDYGGVKTIQFLAMAFSEAILAVSPLPFHSSHRPITNLDPAKASDFQSWPVGLQVI
ncbi:hypothetical protein DID88_004615 [Monilinia fructigena]|uniref:Uncharacterized protein n=1 Tax=Monilinia fructigena TaxID=38457 RepID=A0A395ITP3_9HELO|nr:hypothetical protein DID88_004615 [Monilinia fructigena]